MERKALGKRINLARKDMGITAEQLSERCNINATYLRQIEGGIKIPSLPVFISLCNELKTSPGYLLQDDICINEFSQIEELEELYKTATPGIQKLVVTMLRAALEHIKRGS